MKKTLLLISLTSLFVIPLFIGGCGSGSLGLSAGGDLIWWCDKCQQQVANPKTHICNKTIFDKKTNRDVPINGVSNNEIEELLKKDRSVNTQEQNNIAPPAQPTVTKKKWKFWQKKK